MMRRPSLNLGKPALGNVHPYGGWSVRSQMRKLWIRFRYRTQLPESESESPKMKRAGNRHPITGAEADMANKTRRRSVVVHDVSLIVNSELRLAKPTASGFWLLASDKCTCL